MLSPSESQGDTSTQFPNFKRSQSLLAYSRLRQQHFRINFEF